MTNKEASRNSRIADRLGAGVPDGLSKRLEYPLFGLRSSLRSLCMRLGVSMRNIALVLCGLGFFSSLGCHGADGQGGGGSSLSGPPVLIAAYQGRAPRQCSSVTSPPTVVQATAMVQCWSDAVSAFGLFLYQDVKIQMAAGRPYVLTSDSYLAQIDSNAKVYPLRGSYTYYACSGINNLVPAGQQCRKQAVPQALGMCWKTSFGEWKCFVQGNVAPETETVAAPTAY
jgi:hypothetical protein